MELSLGTLELLRDEAYLFLCRDACEKRMDVLVREASDVVRSRPIFGILAGRRTRTAFADSVQTVVDTESGLRDRLASIARLNNWVRRCIRSDLIEYLASASPEFARMVRLGQLLNHWETGVQQMPDLLVAFARDMRALGHRATESLNASSSATSTFAREFTVLRDIAVRLEEEQKQLDELAATINAETQEMVGNDVRLPCMPACRRSVWVDWLALIPLDQVVAEVTRVEFEVRAFITSGMVPVSDKLKVTRTWCTATQENLVEQYWVQLRAHALAHYVTEGDVDEVLESITQRYDAQIARGHRELMNDPFLAER